MNQDIDLVAVDIGYGYVKAISRNTNKRVIFAAGVGDPVDDKTLGLLGKNSEEDDPNNIHIRINAKEYFVGELAKKKSPEFRTALDNRRYENDIMNTLLNVAIQLVSDSEDVYLVTGLPYELYAKHRDSLIESVSGNQPPVEWKSGSRQGTKQQVNVEKAIILPQAMSAVFSVLFNEKGDPIRPDLMDEDTTIGLIDIGHKTTDYVFLEIEENGQLFPVDTKSSTINAGGVDMDQAIKDKFIKETDETDISQRNLKKAYNKGKLKYRSDSQDKNIDFSNEIQSTKEKIAGKIFGEIGNYWGNELNTIDEIFFVGGGVLLYGKEVQEKFGNRLKEINDSQFANVQGYLFYGDNILKQQTKEN